MTSQLSPIKLQLENYRLQAELIELRSRYESLQKSETRYRQIFENSPISMLCISTKGETIEMNSAAEEFLGWTIAGEIVIEPPMYFEPSSTIGQGQWKWARRQYYPIRDAAKV